MTHAVQTAPPPARREPAGAEGSAPELSRVEDRPGRDASATVATATGARSRLALQVHSQLPSRTAGRQLYTLLAAKIRTLPGLASSCWQIADGRQASRTGTLTMTVSMVVELDAYAGHVADSATAGDRDDLVAALHVAAVAHVRDRLSPTLKHAAVAGWQLTGAPVADAQHA